VEPEVTTANSLLITLLTHLVTGKSLNSGIESGCHTCGSITLNRRA